MTIVQVLEHYGGIARTAESLGISYQAVQQWSDKNKVPDGRQYQIQVQTKGKLLAEKSCAA